MTRCPRIPIVLATLLAACASSPQPGLSWAEIPGSPGVGDSGAAIRDAATVDPGTQADPSSQPDLKPSDTTSPTDPGLIGYDIPTPGDLPVTFDPGPDTIVAPDVAPDVPVGPDVPVVPDVPVIPDVAPPECLLGEVRSISCGLNGRGIQPQACIDGMWTNQGTCQDLDVCKDTDERVAGCADGKGKIRQECVAGQWVDAGPCIQPGRWDCKNNVCTPVFGSKDCGDGQCDEWDGESRTSCPADCDFSGQSGEGVGCKNAYDCAFYGWPHAGQTGFWECAWTWEGKKCKAVKSDEYCGTPDWDWCYIQNGQIETDLSCPADCPPEAYNCGSDVECMFHPWPAL